MAARVNYDRMRSDHRSTTIARHSRHLSHSTRRALYRDREVTRKNHDRARRHVS